jgi:hypothetical protein
MCQRLILFINIQINDVKLFCWNIKSLTGFSKVVMYLPGVGGFSSYFKFGMIKRCVLAECVLSLRIMQTQWGKTP